MKKWKKVLAEICTVLIFVTMPGINVLADEMQEEEVGYVYSQVTTKNNAEEPDIPESSDNDFESDSDDEQTGEENPDVPA